jgi:N-acetylmuramoyl-L-alanine amidase
MAKTPDKLTMPSQVSGHCLVDKNGDIYQMVADSDEVWHAFGQNADSIGIEHVARPGEQLMPAQEQATAHLCRWLLAEYKIPKEQITGHRFTPHNRTRTDCPHSLFSAQAEEALRVWVDQYFN